MASTQQEQIVRQSQIKLALDYFNACGVCPTMVDLMKTTTMLEQFIINGYSNDLVSSFNELDKHIQKEYKG